MDDEPIFRLRKVKPMLAISTTAVVKRWVETEAIRKSTTQANVVNRLILDEMERQAAESDDDAEEDAA